MLPEPRLARQIIDVLGQSGTPLSKGVSYYNVGNESLLNTIDSHYLGSYLADGGAVFKLTQARSGLSTLSLLENAFKGAPSYALCKAHKAADLAATGTSSFAPARTAARRKRARRSREPCSARPQWPCFAAGPKDSNRRPPPP